MTIPIVPGPFSFLAELGKGVGTAFKVAEDQRRVKREQAQEDRAEASRNLMNAIDLYSKGVLKKLDINTILELGARAGMGDFLTNNVVPRPENIVAEGQSGYLSQLLGGGEGANAPEFGNATPSQAGVLGQRRPGQGPAPTAPTAERQATLATGRIQSQAEVAKERETAAGATARAETIEGGGAAGRAQAGVLAEPVAVAGEEKARDVFYDSVAGRTVDSALTRAGGNILTQDLNALADSAWQTANEDARSRNYVLDESVTRPYIEAAIAGRYRDALTEEAKVRAQMARAGSDEYDNYLKILQNNQAMIRQQIAALPEPSEQTYTFARAYEAQIARQRTPEEQRAFEANPGTQFLRSAYEQVQQYQKTVNQLNSELNGNRDQLSNALGGKIPTVGGATPGREGRKLSDQQVDAVIQRMRQNNISTDQIDKDVAAGLISAADGAAIKERLTTGAGARF